ncbi:uncharacterized protein LOC111630677 [Centruroides sculpturatus]|uniref:uncharacterized protein LOC111630677 n=1 Tax=Centruroides sculpturatus TaxID=218467 RepID=UPI000C6D8EA8|nr:uncharacterized protein LOC111630677 [Centruroides sculpturatus]
MGKRKGNTKEIKQNVVKSKEKENAASYCNVTVSNIGTKGKNSENVRRASKHDDHETATILVVNENDQKEIHVHKHILANSSPKFKEILDGEAEDKKIVIEGISEKDVKLFLSFARGNQVKILHLKQAWNFLKLAERFEYPILCDLAVSYILEHTNIDNVCDVYKKALDVQNEKLILKTLHFILKEAGEIFKAHKIRGLPPSTLDLILSQDIMNVENEVQLFDALAYWAKTEIREKIDITPSDVLSKMRPFLDKIRFLSMTEKQYREGPAKSSLFTEQQNFQMLDRIADEKSRIPLPFGSRIREKRKPFPEKIEDLYIRDNTLVNYCQNKHKNALSTVQVRFRSKNKAIFITSVLLRDCRRRGDFIIVVENSIRYRKLVDDPLGIIELHPPVFIRRNELFEFVFRGVEAFYSCENLANFSKAPFYADPGSSEHNDYLPMPCFFWSVLYFTP